MAERGQRIFKDGRLRLSAVGRMAGAFYKLCCELGTSNSCVQLFIPEYCDFKIKA
jgi:hypothetical protein